MVESGSVPENDRIWARTEKWKNLGQYRKMIESGRVPEKVRIGASIEKLFERVPKNGRIRVSAGK